MTPLVKICGLSERATLDAALDAGADMVGLVFFEPSPRHLGYDTAVRLADHARGRAAIVALTVDADDARMDAIARHVRPDFLQLHGSETPARLAVLKARYPSKLIKTIKVSQADDLAAAADHVDVADMLLYDAKAPKGAPLPGGNGLAFDWTLLARAPRDLPMMLAGGLHAGNIAAAIALVHPDAVDVSSGVERAPGRKDETKIKEFLAAARTGAASATDRVRQGGRV